MLHNYLELNGGKKRRLREELEGINRRHGSWEEGGGRGEAQGELVVAGEGTSTACGDTSQSAEGELMEERDAAGPARAARPPSELARGDWSARRSRLGAWEAIGKTGRPSPPPTS